MENEGRIGGSGLGEESGGYKRYGDCEELRSFWLEILVEIKLLHLWPQKMASCEDMIQNRT